MTASNQWFPTLPSFPQGGAGSSQQPWDWSGTTKSPVTWGSPAMPNVNNLFQVPQQTSNFQSGGSPMTPVGSRNLGHGIIATGLQFPGLAGDFASWLQSQIGKGMTPYNLQTQLPTGGITQPGQLTAGLNPLMQQLMQFFQGQGGSTLPGADALSTITNQGISALPEWQKMIAAQQQNIGQNQANLREQFAGMGGLAGSPFGNAMSNYMQQTTLDENALLAKLQQENILQGQLPAAEFLQQQGQQFGGLLQGLDQQAIDAMYKEFQRVAPQNNPLLGYMAQLSGQYPPTNMTPTTGQSAMQWISTISSAFKDVMGGIGGMMGGNRPT